MLSIYDYQNLRLADLRMLDDRIEGEAYDLVLKENLNALSELQFTVPFYTMIDGIQEVNWRIDSLINEYKVRLTFQDFDEYFYIKNIEEIHDSKGLRYQVSCTHVAEILNKRGVNRTVDVTGNADTLLTAILSGSGWTVGTVSTFEKKGIEKIRAYQKDTSSCMEMLWDIVELFEAYVRFNSITKTIDFLNDIGSNDGVWFRYDKNIKEINRQYNTDDIVTRLWVIGGSVDDQIITITDVNPTKQPFIDNFSYFEALLSPAQKSAIAQYKTDIKVAYYDILTMQDTITTTKNIIATTQNSIDIKTVERAAKIQAKAEVDSKIIIEKDPITLSALQSQSSTLLSQISVLDSELVDFQYLLANNNTYLSMYNADLNMFQSQKTTIENNFKVTMDEFIREGVYKSEQYSNAQALYDDALEIIAKVSVPKVEYNMSVIDLSQLVGYELERIRLGDIIGITDEPLHLGVDSPVAARITELVRYLDNPFKNTITIANFRNAFSDMWSRIAKSVEIVKQRRDYYERAYLGLTDQGLPKGDILQQTFDVNKFNIVSGVNNNVEITKDKGIIVKDINDINKQTHLIAGGIYLTTDGGATFKEALTPHGLSAVNITSGVIDTKNIQIWNTSQPKFYWNDKGLFAYGSNNNQYVKFNQDGLVATLDGGNTYEFSLTWAGLQIGKHSVSGLQTDLNNLQSGINNSVQLNSLYNKVKISTSQGIQIYDSSNNERLKMGDLGSGVYGFYTKDASGNIKTQIRSDGTLSAVGADFSGIVKATDFQNINGVSLMNSAKTLIEGSSIKADTLFVNSANITGKLQANQIETSQLIVGTNIAMGPDATLSYSQITNKPYIPTLPSYITSTKITQTSIESPSISGGTVTGVSFVGGSLNIGNGNFTVNSSGIMAATGAIIKTSNSGNRIEFTPDGGLIQYNQYGNKRIQIDSSYAGGSIYLGLDSDVRGVIEESGGAFSIYPKGSGQMILGTAGKTTFVRGNWDFRDASTNITVKLA